MLNFVRRKLAVKLNKKSQLYIINNEAIEIRAKAWQRNLNEMQ